MGKMFKETYVSPLSLGAEHLRYKLQKIKEEYPDAEVTYEEGRIPQAGSASTPYAGNWGCTEPGYRISVKRPVKDLGYNIDATV